ncbi:hypothetical protein ACFJ5Y_001247 [Vibrio parahaemolyticus]
MNLTILKNIVAITFSLPFVILVNAIWGIISLVAAFTVDKSKFPINCELDNLATVQTGGFESMGYIVSETAVALRAAELGVPEFLSTPIIPFIFGLVWVVKFVTLEDKSFQVWAINLVLASLTFSAVLIGFSTKFATWWDVEQVKNKLSKNEYLLTSYSYVVNEAIDSTEKLKDKSTCDIAIEMSLLVDNSTCEGDDFPSCYIDFIDDESRDNLLEDKRQQWLHDFR